MISFCALDFETATFERSSACEVGICVVEEGKKAFTKTWLIKPPSYPYFHPRTVAIHGIHPEEVADAPTFAEIWDEINDLLHGNLMIAHNASFDAGVLNGTLDYYGLFKPKLQYLCSLKLAKKSWKNLPSYGLKNLANLHGIQFNHHRAGDDAQVCAELSLLGFERLMITRQEEISAFFNKDLRML